jgi:peptidoglycan-N-acetylglucosamine deacetylase
MPRVHVILRHLLRPQIVVGAFVVVAIMIGWAMPRADSSAKAQPTLQFVFSVSRVQQATISVPVQCAQVRCLALTFDDGPSADLTPQVLDILQRRGAKATFFVLGSRVAGNEALLRRMHREGHEIGNHSWGHPYFTRLSFEQIDAEVNNTQAVIMRAGVPAPRLFRPPYGDVNDAVIAHIPLTVMRWNIDPEDWHPKKRQHIFEHMAAYAKPGGVVVLHDTEATTVEKLDMLIQQLQTQGYTLVPVGALLSLPSGQPGVFFGR